MKCIIILSNKDSACNYQRTQKESNLHYGYILENYFQFLDITICKITFVHIIVR